MQDVVIVSTARTGIGKAFRGALNATHGATLGAHVVRVAVERAGLDGGEVADVMLGCAVQEGATAGNIGRASVLEAGLPVTVPGFVLDRKCASGLQTIALAAQRIRGGEDGIYVAGGVESVSLTMAKRAAPPQSGILAAMRPGFYLSMIETGQIVAERYGISREAQDAFGVESHRRAAGAQAAGRLNEEIVAMSATKLLYDKAGEVTGGEQIIFDRDEGVRAETTIEGLAKLKPVLGSATSVTAGNASQLSDGASACVVMSAAEAARRGLTPLGLFRGFAVAGCEPDEMGIGPIFAIPKLLAVQGLAIDDIDLWEVNEAFASQVLYCAHRLGIPIERLNVNGGSIAMGHPFGMTGSRLTGHLLIEGRRRKVRYGVVSMCIAGGMGAAALFEIA